jgi:hypothetical protein
MATRFDLTDADETPAASQPAQLPEAEVRALHVLQAKGDYSAAAAGAVKLLAAHPANRDLLLIEAHSLRMMKQTDAALAALERFAQHHPGFSQMFL